MSLKPLLRRRAIGVGSADVVENGVALDERLPVWEKERLDVGRSDSALDHACRAVSIMLVCERVERQATIDAMPIDFESGLKRSLVSAHQQGCFGQVPRQVHRDG